jgi:hypothetical protein
MTIFLLFPRLLPSILWHPCYLVHISPTLVPILSQTDPALTLTFYFFRTHFNFILHLDLLSCRFHSVFPSNFLCISLLCHVCYMLCPSSMLTLPNTFGEQLLITQSSLHKQLEGAVRTHMPTACVDVTPRAVNVTKKTASSTRYPVLRLSFPSLKTGSSNFVTYPIMTHSQRYFRHNKQSLGPYTWNAVHNVFQLTKCNQKWLMYLLSICTVDIVT